MKKFLAGSTLFVGVLTLGACVTQPPAQVYQDCKVTSKDRVGKQDSSSSDMRVYTQNCGTFKVEDYHGRTNSADVFGQIVPDKTYDITAFGNRNTSWSEFPNIVSVEEVKTP